MLLFKIFVIILPIFLTGCGFTPLYKQHIHDHKLNESLSLIKISITNNDELSNLLKDHLIEIFGQNNKQKYLLKITANKHISAAVIQNNTSIGRYSLNIAVNYELQSIDTGIIIDKNSLSMRGGYDDVQSQYATYVAEEYEIKNLIREISNQIHIRISTLLKRDNL